MTRMREGGSVATILLKDWARLVAVITVLAVPEIGVMAAEAVQSLIGELLLGLDRPRKQHRGVGAPAYWDLGRIGRAAP